MDVRRPPLLSPRKNKFRSLAELKGPWTLRFGPREPTRRIPVPASWNEVFPDQRDHLGPAWYKTRFPSPAPDTLEDRRLFLRFGSVNYLADVFLNGRKLGSHEGGHLPFAFGIHRHLLRKRNDLVVRVDGRLAPDRVPPGNVPRDPKDTFGNVQYPDTSFDFFPYCGIHRKVLLVSVPEGGLDDLTVVPSLHGKDGLLRVLLRHASKSPVSARLTLAGQGRMIRQEVPPFRPAVETVLKVPRARLWAPGSPNLYRLTVELLRDGKPFDRYDLPVGIRTIEVRKGKLLLNGRPVFLRGFGRHEDYPGTGRGFSPRWAAKDFGLLRWVGADSFRTSHYPYAEEQMDWADKKGFLVIDETPAVGLFFARKGLGKRERLCRRSVRELIERDKNHPSVILWSLANEPHSKKPAALPFFRRLARLARSLDPTRPLTLASYLGSQEGAFRFLDVVCVNRYFGWYSEQGRLDLALPKLSHDLDVIHRKFKKPVLLTEFGADAIAGKRSRNPDMFSEDYQAALIEGYLKVAGKKPYIVGTHVWNLCDFKTPQAVHRPAGLNHKGVFTRERKPKLAARLLRERWKIGRTR